MPYGQPGGGSPHTITIGGQTFSGSLPKSPPAAMPYYTSPRKTVAASADPDQVGAKYTSTGSMDPHFPTSPGVGGIYVNLLPEGYVVKGSGYEGQKVWQSGGIPSEVAAMPQPAPPGWWKVPGAGNASPVAPAATPAGTVNPMSRYPGLSQPSTPTLPSTPSTTPATAPSITQPPATPAGPGITPSSTVGGSLAAIVNMFPEGSPARGKLQTNLDRFLADPRGSVVSGLSLSEIGTLFRGLKPK